MVKESKPLIAESIANRAVNVGFSSPEKKIYVSVTRVAQLLEDQRYPTGRGDWGGAFPGTSCHATVDCPYGRAGRNFATATKTKPVANVPDDGAPDHTVPLRTKVNRPFASLALG